MKQKPAGLPTRDCLLALLALAAVIVAVYPGHFLDLGVWRGLQDDNDMHRAVVAHVVRSYQQSDWGDVLTVPWLAPYRQTIFFTETFLLPSLMILPATWVIDNPLLWHDLAAVLGWILSVLIAFALARKLGLSRLAAFAATLIVSLNAMRLPFMKTCFIHAIFLYLAAMWFLFDAAENRRPMRLFIALLLLLLPAYASGYLFPVGAIAFIPFLLYLAIRERWWTSRGFWLALIAAGFIWAISFLPFAHLLNDTFTRFGYDAEWHYWKNGLLLSDFLVSGSHPLLRHFAPDPIPNNHHAYLGLIAVVLACIGLFGLRRKEISDADPAWRVARRWLNLLIAISIPLAVAIWHFYLLPIKNLRPDQQQALAVGFVFWPVMLRLIISDWGRRLLAGWRDVRFWLLVLFLLVLLIAAGPFFSVAIGKYEAIGGRAVLFNPLGYLLAHTPGFTHMRSLPRVIVFAFVGLGLLAGFGLDRLRAKKGLTLTLLALALLAADTLPVHTFGGWHTDRTNTPMPQSYVDLAHREPGDILFELPAPGVWDFGAEIPLVTGTVWHGQRLLTGYSGRFTPHRNVIAELSEQERFTDLYLAINAAGTKYILIRQDLAENRPLPPLPPAPWQLIADHDGELLFMHPSPQTTMFGAYMLDDLCIRPAKKSRSVEAYLPDLNRRWFFTDQMQHKRLRWELKLSDSTTTTAVESLRLPASLYCRDAVKHWRPGVEGWSQATQVKVFDDETGALLGEFNLPDHVANKDESN